MSDRWFAALQFCIALFLAPLLPAVVNRTKAIFAGRRGPPLMQGYRDLAKLLSKAAVYSRTTTWVFRAGPTVGLAAVVIALAMLPWAGGIALVSFAGDIVLFATLFGLARFLTILAALDTGSAFEGMGASREAWRACPAVRQSFPFRHTGRAGSGRRGRGGAAACRGGRACGLSG
jgi:formate hydrogenlyase subunit 4